MPVPEAGVDRKVDRLEGRGGEGGDDLQDGSGGRGRDAAATRRDTQGSRKGHARTRARIRTNMNISSQPKVLNFADPALFS